MSDIGKFGAAAGKVVAAGIAATGAAVAAASGYSVNLAKNYEQTVGAMNTLYGPSVVSNIEKWNAAQAKGIGVSKASAAEIQKSAAIQVRTLGLEGDAATEFLKKHTTNMADVGAMYNASAEQIAVAHSAVMRGEYDSAEKYGVQITADMVKRKMATDGLTESQARQALWVEQTAIANGQAARESGSLAGIMERVKATVDNLALALGEALLPAVANAAGKFLDFIDAVAQSEQFKSFIDWVANTAIPAFAEFAKQVVEGAVKGLTDLSNWYNENKDIINTLAVAVGAAAAVWAIWTGAIAAWTAITTLASAAQAIFSAIMEANPIMLVVMAVAALVAGLVYFFTQTETGRAIWEKFTTALTTMWQGFTDFLSNAWARIKAAFSEGASAIGGFITRAKDTIVNVWNAIISFFSGIPGKITGVFSNAGSMLLNAGRGIITGLQNGVTGAWGAVSSWFSGVGGRITSALGNVGSILMGAGQAIISGFLSGLKAKWGEVTSFVSGIASWIANNKGPLSYDYKLLQPAGKAIMDGFGKSLEDGFSDVQGMVKGFGPELSGSLSSGFDGDVKMNPAGGTYYSFDGMTFNMANAEEAAALEEFMGFLRRKTRAGV